jgi:hypothetical protein
MKFLGIETEIERYTYESISEYFHRIFNKTNDEISKTIGYQKLDNFVSNLSENEKNILNIRGKHNIRFDINYALKETILIKNVKAISFCNIALPKKFITEGFIDNDCDKIIDKLKNKIDEKTKKAESLQHEFYDSLLEKLKINDRGLLSHDNKLVYVKFNGYNLRNNIYIDFESLTDRTIITKGFNGYNTDKVILNYFCKMDEEFDKNFILSLLKK